MPPGPTVLIEPLAIHEYHSQKWWTQQNLLEGKGMSSLQIVCWLFSAHNYYWACLFHSKMFGIDGVSLWSSQSSKQNKNSMSYLSKSKPGFCPRKTWLLGLSLSLAALRMAREFGVAPGCQLAFTQITNVSHNHSQLHKEACSLAQYHRSSFSGSGCIFHLKCNCPLSGSYACFELPTILSNWGK